MAAKIIGIAQSKGGVGKSTLCANLSVTLSQNAKVLMIDCDPPQYSLNAWYQIRDNLYIETGLDIKSASTPSQLNTLVANATEQYDYIVIDGAPHVNPLVRAMLLSANLIILPLAPSSVEIWSLDSIQKLINEASKYNKNLSCKIVWNRVRKRVKSSQDVMEKVNKETDFKPFKNLISFRVAYMDSFAEGCSVYEWSDSIASAEVWSLSSAVKRVLSKLSTIKPNHSASAQNFVRKG